MSTTIHYSSFGQRNTHQNPVKLSARYKGPKRAGLVLYRSTNWMLVHMMYIASCTSNARTAGIVWGKFCKKTKIATWVPNCIGSLKFSWFFGTRIWFGVKDSYRSSHRTMRGKSQSGGCLPAVYFGRLFRRAHISSNFIVPIATRIYQQGNLQMCLGLLTHSQNSGDILPARKILALHMGISRKLLLKGMSRFRITDTAL
jgi:hypothetical protein